MWTTTDQEPVFDCYFDPETQACRSHKSMSELTTLAESHGYILVPRYITSTARLEELIRPARECAEAHERLSAIKPEAVFDGESQSATNP